MANSKVSDLTAASALDGTELYYGVQGGADRKVTGAQITGGVRIATTTLNTATILSLFTTPVTLIAAPGSGYAISIIDYTYEAAFNSIAFTWAGVAGMYYNGDASDQIDNSALTDFIKTTYDRIGLNMVSPATTAISDGTIDRASVENKAVMLAAFTSNPINGNGAVYVTMRYRIYAFQG